ncbi:unnamed protein product, partial [Allacma fusca]
MKSSEE